MDKLQWLGALVLAIIASMLSYGLLMFTIGSVDSINVLWVDRIASFLSGMVFTLVLFNINEEYGG